jgi:hypothetical protein
MKRAENPTTGEKDIEQIFEDGTLIDEALAQGVQEALRIHKQAGLPIVVWEDGQTVWIPAEKISLLEDGSWQFQIPE